MSKDCNIPFSPEYADRLSEVYDEQIAGQITGPPRQADLIEHIYETMPYVRAGYESTLPRPVLYVPGFTEGIIAKAPFAAEMVLRGFDVILPGQHRHKLTKDDLGQKNATQAQALNYLNVLKNEHLPRPGTPVDVVTHSYGSLIFSCMLALKPKWFTDSRVIMLAPGGTNELETLPSLGRRFLKHAISERKTEKDFPDTEGDMMKAGMKNLMANKLRSWREVRELATDRLDYKRLMNSGIASLAVLGFAEDDLFPAEVLQLTIQRALSHGVTYAVPYSVCALADGTNRGGKDASHNDDQFNPGRVADSIAELLAA